MERSVIKPDGSVDISRLEREIKEDLSLHRKHTAEDGMKKKAIHTSKDYDEFKSFVSVAQLKPTTSRDVSSLFSGTLGTGPGGSGNAACRNRNEVDRGVIGGYGESIQLRKDATVDLKQNEKKSKSIDGGPDKASKGTASRSNKSSRKAHDFIKELKQQCKSPEQTISFLSRIEPSHDVNSTSKMNFVLPAADTCEVYFTAEIDCEILGDIIEGLHLISQVAPLASNDKASTSDCVTSKLLDGNSSPICHQCLENIWAAGSNALEFTAGWLGSLASCGRFGLSVSFLTLNQTEKLKEILDFVRRSSTESHANAYLEKYDQALG